MFNFRRHKSFHLHTPRIHFMHVFAIVLHLTLFTRQLIKTERLKSQAVFCFFRISKLSNFAKTSDLSVKEIIETETKSK